MKALAAQGEGVDLSSNGLVAWFPFEDGSSRLTSKMISNLPPPAKKQKTQHTGDTAPGGQGANTLTTKTQQPPTQKSKINSTTTTKSVAVVAGGGGGGGKKPGFVQRSRALHKQVQGGDATAATTAGGAVGVSADGSRAVSPLASRPASGSRSRPGTSGNPDTEEDEEDEAATEEQKEAKALMKELIEDWKKNRVADVSEHRFPVLLQQRIEDLSYRPPDPLQLQAMQAGLWAPTSTGTNMAVGFTPTARKSYGKQAGKTKPSGGGVTSTRTNTLPLTTPGKKGGGSESEGEGMGSKGLSTKGGFSTKTGGGVGAGVTAGGTTNQSKSKDQGGSDKVGGEKEGGTVVGMKDALREWSKSGGEGLKWRWLDANYLSSLSQV